VNKRRKRRRGGEKMNDSDRFGKASIGYT